ncbi:MAG: MFS transporter [Pseudomonadota bacterium]|nr:MFS transporter [Pseudomonadota bacterium]
MNAAAGVKLPIRTKLAYGLGTVAFGIKDQGFNALLMLYYNQVVGLPASWVGTAILIAMLVDAVSDPLIGHYSDHLKSRWGRRHPFMYASALPLAFAYFLLWSPPSGSQELQFVYLLLTSIAVRVALSCYEIPASALLPEFTSDYNERTSIATYRALFLAVGSVGMAVLVFKLFLQPTAEQPVGQLNADGYAHYGIAAAIVMLFSVLLSAWGTHHRIPTLATSQHAERVGLGELWRGMKTLLQDRAYLSILACSMLFAIAVGFSTSIGTYVSTYFWHLNADHLAIIAGSLIWGLVLALVVIQLSKRFGKKETTMTLYSIALVAVIVPVVLGLQGMISMEIDVLLPWLVAKNILLTMCIIAALVLATSMGADVADHFELKTGQRMEGLMFAAFIMTNKAVSGMGVFLSGVALTVIGFPEQATPETVDPLIVDRLAWIYVIAMGSLCGLAIAVLGLYPITRATHEQTQRALGKL